MGDVKEGFLCPICMSDLGNVQQLQIHFEEKHAKEDPAFLQGLKDLFGKAKSKILSNSESNPSLLSSNASTGDLNQDLSSLATSFGAGLLRGLNNSSNQSAKNADVDPSSGVRRDVLSSRPDLVIVDHSVDFKKERRKKIDRNKSTRQVSLLCSAVFVQFLISNL